ncbi:hypothetical protein LUZ63_017949 [Rhynchospora breviuscula]|uniref:Membrane-associated kinase regulator 4 n=1 Tax=Rhynchospora breviuscula TaxID=2022672 RepID=A0A9Q0C3F8_9POAL|nr:hypothetical protein LUZ63_017949 [Rhynchospora breviuscula]
MAKTTTQAYEDAQEEEYIDMDINSTTFTYHKRSSPPHNTREFEFHNSTPLEKEPIASPADELFYKGKLLPLHLPPRLRMVENLLDNPNSTSHLDASTLCNTTNTTPFASCNASPANSCYVSGELSTEDYFYECSSGMAGTETSIKKSWSKKLKFIRQLNLGSKLKAPKAYLKSIFTNGSTKSVVFDDKCTISKPKEYSNGYLKAWKKSPFGQIRRERCIASSINCKSPIKFVTGEEERGHRRSFSSAIIRNSMNKSSFSSVSSSCSSSNCSSFSCASSNGSCPVCTGPVLKRSSSANSEMENPIQGAIAYCKKSQQLASVRKSLSDTGFCFVTGMKIAADCEELDDEDIYVGVEI